MVTVKGYVDHVVIVAEGQVIATHARSFEKQTMVLDPIHYLATLGRKPGALSSAPVFRDWKLPACFAALRGALEGLHGRLGGSRRFVRVLQLLGEHPLTRVTEAVAACQRESLTSAEAVIPRTRSLGAIEAAPRGGAAPPGESCTIPPVQVPLPDLSRFNQLLGDPASEDPVSAFAT
jgi:hypothetical protein